MIEYREQLDEFGKPIVVISDKEKRDIEYTVRRVNMGSALWKVTCGTGPIPKDLQGYNTTMDAACDRVESYLNKSKVTRTVKRNLRRAAKSEANQHTQ